MYVFFMSVYVSVCVKREMQGERMCMCFSCSCVCVCMPSETQRGRNPAIKFCTEAHESSHSLLA